MANSADFQPNWASMPGDTILDLLKDKSLTFTDFAKKMDSTVDDAKRLVHGFIAINSDVAKKLENALGISAQFWITRETQYRNSIDRLKHTEEAKWIKELPVKDMEKFGWLSHTSNVAVACLSYFNVPDVWTWRRQYSEVTALTAFRKSSAVKSNPAAIAAWLRQGEIRADKMIVDVWNLKAFQKILTEIRVLVKRKSPANFLPILQKACASAGVCVIIAPTPAGCGASGATKFIAGDKAMILMSFRFLSDDHFWFTFFHECGHLLLHGEKQLFIEGEVASESSADKEREANQFATDVLLPKKLQSKLREMPITEKQIQELAKEADVSLGIVVGQLQHIERIPYSKFNSYKRRYSWENIPAT